MKWKPIAASLVLILLALGAMAVWKFSGDGGKGGQGAPNSAPCGPPADGGDDNPRTRRVKLEDLPALDPIELWPLNSMRVSSPEFWVMWRTRDHVPCRLLARGGEGPWYEAGHTLANKHYMQVDISEYGDAVSFCVEWKEGDKAYRSAPRRVSFGAGAGFAKRRYSFDVPSQSGYQFKLAIQGRDVAQLGGEPFMTTFFPEQVNPGTYPIPPDQSVGVQVDGNSIPEEGCFGFLQVYDSTAVTYDRVLIELKRGQ